MKINQKDIYIPTGNEQVSIPTLYSDGSIESINVLSMKYRGLIELCGTKSQPLMRPIVKENGNELCFAFDWERENYWIPTFKGIANDLTISGEIVAPIEERGFYYHLNLENHSETERELEWGLIGTWIDSLHTINESKRIRGSKSVFESGWNHSFVFELLGEVPILSFAPMSSFPLDKINYQHHPSSDAVKYELVQTIKLNKGETRTLTIFWGLGLEEVGSTTSAKEMLRQTTSILKARTVRWLQKRFAQTGDAKLDEILNLNLFFNYFYATGLTIDTEEDVLVTSRSPRYYVSAAYWDRDSLLWSFPSILLTDLKRAKRMLDYVFTTQRRNIGVHSRYIDGVVLEPGFELDELCAPIIALDMYLKNSEDWKYLQKDYVQESIELILERLETRKHPEFPLYDTFLQPTDDPIVYPFLTYNNMLVWKLFQIVASWAEHLSLPLSQEVFLQKSQMVKEAIYQHAVINDEKEGKCFAWSFDLVGNKNVYDEPPGSLQLLPYYGFCDRNDSIYKNTVSLIRSDRFSYAFKGCPFEELGCEHADHPWVLSIANSLLSGRKEQAKDFLLRTPMDGGIACESIDEYSGLPQTGEHFATCAGFLAYAIYYAFGKEQEGK